MRRTKYRHELLIKVWVWHFEILILWNFYTNNSQYFFLLNDTLKPDLKALLQFSVHIKMIPWKFFILIRTLELFIHPRSLNFFKKKLTDFNIQYSSVSVCFQTNISDIWNGPISKTRCYRTYSWKKTMKRDGSSMKKNKWKSEKMG